MPLANSFLTAEDVKKEEFHCPLNLVYCSNCHLVQLTHVVPPDLMFSNYLYVSSTTKTFKEHFAEYAKLVKKRLSEKNQYLAVDIGSNDGLLLACYEKEGMRAVGVEPAKNLSDQANRQGFTTINRYFDSLCVNEILKNFGPADVISANNVFAHIDNIQEVCKNMYNLLADRGFLVVEFPYLVTMLDELFFDMIYHEHLSYISITALTYLLNRFNLEVFDVSRVSSHGGSLRVFVQKKGGDYHITQEAADFIEYERKKGCLSSSIYKNFGSRVENFKKKLMDLVREIKSKGQSISGYGAPAKASTLINYCHLSQSQVDYIVDDNSLKQGKFSPGAKIPVVSSSYLSQNPTNYVIIFAWNFAQEIIQKIKPLKAKGVKFIIPLPHFQIV